MSDAQTRGWGDPDREGYARDHIIKINAGGVTLNVRREVAPLIAGFVDALVATGYRLNVRADDWGYNNRDISGRPGVKSNHAWGLAIDLNSATNPMTEDGRAHTDMDPAVVRPLAAQFGLAWGADYTGARRDPMHFEFLGTPDDAAVLVKHHDPADPPADQGDEDDMARLAIYYCRDHGNKDNGPFFVSNGATFLRNITRDNAIHGKNLGQYGEPQAAPHTYLENIRNNETAPNVNIPGDV